MCVVSFFGCSLGKRFLPSLGNGSRLSFGQQGQGYAWQWPCRNNPAMGGLLSCSAEALLFLRAIDWELLLSSLQLRKFFGIFATGGQYSITCLTCGEAVMRCIPRGRCIYRKLPWWHICLGVLCEHFVSSFSEACTSGLCSWLRGRLREDLVVEKFI